MIDFAGEEFDDVEDKATYQSMLARDERRFKNADRDRDGIATREEFTAFLHPEEFDYMKDVVVQVYTPIGLWRDVCKSCKPGVRLTRLIVFEIMEMFSDGPPDHNLGR